MKKIDVTQLIEAGAHFGHLTRRWNPKMRPYIFMEKNGIHIIDLKKNPDTDYRSCRSFIRFGFLTEAKSFLWEQKNRPKILLKQKPEDAT